jgi:hypothetical protein
MDSSISRRLHATLEPLHAMIYFAPEAAAEYEKLGLSGQAELYFPSRAAAFGVVPWQVVQATFFGFSPLAVQFGLAEAWSKTTPQDVLAARLRGVDGALRRMVGERLGDCDEVLDLLRDAVQGCEAAGRPLHAAHAALPEPAEPHLAVWQHVATLREHRGDGHIAALVAADLTAAQSQVLNGAYKGAAMTKFLRQTRAWSEQEWADAAAQLVDRGWVDGDGDLTDAGRTAREDLERQTDVLALAPWRHLGEERSLRLRDLLQPWTDAVAAAGGLPGAMPAR